MQTERVPSPSEGVSRLLSASEAADRLSVTPKTLSNWRRDGRGPDVVRLGRLVRYAPSDLEAFIQASRRSTMELA